MLCDIYFLATGKYTIYKIHNIYTINQGKHKPKNYDTFLQAFCSNLLYVYMQTYIKKELICSS